MGLCVSMLQRTVKNRYHEPRRATHKALFVVKNDRLPPIPQALVVQAQNPGGSGFQKPRPRLPCGSAGSVAVEPVAPERRESVFRGATTAADGCRTPMTPLKTPVWQRRILMGTRCELPRFSGLILYDEHGRRLSLIFNFSNISNIKTVLTGQTVGGDKSHGSIQNSASDVSECDEHPTSFSASPYITM